MTRVHAASWVFYHLCACGLFVSYNTGSAKTASSVAAVEWSVHSWITVQRKRASVMWWVRKTFTSSCNSIQARRHFNVTPLFEMDDWQVPVTCCYLLTFKQNSHFLNGEDVYYKRASHTTKTRLPLQADSFFSRHEDMQGDAVKTDEQTKGSRMQSARQQIPGTAHPANP